MKSIDRSGSSFGYSGSGACFWSPLIFNFTQTPWNELLTAAGGGRFACGRTAFLPRTFCIHYEKSSYYYIKGTYFTMYIKNIFTFPPICGTLSIQGDCVFRFEFTKAFKGGESYAQV